MIKFFPKREKMDESDHKFNGMNYLVDVVPFFNYLNY